eukprot:Rhum_TRINITY_DN14494_c15_g1::Rhum_TRINITY_DN14494_c15_g1_i1::g.92977::m.92977/K14838/NOP15; nucleolar protein 15
MVKTKVVKVAAPAAEAEADAAPVSALKKGMPKVLKRVKSTKFFMGEGEKPKALPAKVPKKKKVVVKDAGAATKRIKDKRLGVCYISHLPHGFYENQVRTFLSQYGRIKRLRLSRSKRTGASKGYGFVQFEDPDAAEEIAEDLNGTFLTGKVLRVEAIAPEKVHKDLWRGMKMNKLQKKDEERRVNGRLYNYVELSKKPWEARLMRNVTTERSMNEKLRSAGIAYEFKGFENQLTKLGLDYVPKATTTDSASAGVTAASKSKDTSAKKPATPPSQPKKAVTKATKKVVKKAQK